MLVQGRPWLYDCGENVQGHTVVEAVLMLGARLNLAVVAEGVETQQQLGKLWRLGCAFVQGFLTGRPMTADQASAAMACKSAERTR